MKCKYDELPKVRKIRSLQAARRWGGRSVSRILSASAPRARLRTSGFAGVVRAFVCFFFQAHTDRSGLPNRFRLLLRELALPSCSMRSLPFSSMYRSVIILASDSSLSASPKLHNFSSKLHNSSSLLCSASAFILASDWEKKQWARRDLNS